VGVSAASSNAGDVAFSGRGACGAKLPVENLWTIGAFPVHSATAQLFFTRSVPDFARRDCGRRLRTALRLFACDGYV